MNTARNGDRRFRLTLPEGEWTVRPFRPKGDRLVCGDLPGPGLRSEQALPAVDGLEGLVAVPHLDWTTNGADTRFSARFAPLQPLSVPPFTISYGAGIDGGGVS